MPVSRNRRTRVKVFKSTLTSFTSLALFPSHLSPYSPPITGVGLGVGSSYKPTFMLQLAF